MIYVVFTDRLGNNLFQLSAGLSLSNNITICVPIQEEYIAALKFKDTFFKDIKILDFVPNNIPIYEEPFYRYNKIPYCNDSDIILKGFFQSYMYMDRNKVLNQFSIDKITLNFIEKKYPEILADKYTSIHVRRGDYLKMLYKHPFCGLKYYQKAISIIGDNENFIVVSDDIDWCKRHIKLKNVVFVENTSPIIDFFIQSYCENNIISNSSYSWWAAYLNNHKNKIVIAPRLWFGFKNTLNISDLLLPDYKIINNYYSPLLFVKAWWQVLVNKIYYMKTL